jgi:DNA-binding beta-propeller fold protein YncE
VAVLDAKTLAVLVRIPAGRFPDGSAYVPSLAQLYVSDESGEAEIVIDTKVNRLLATLPLGGEAGMSAYDPVTGHVFVNVQSLRQLDEIDPKTGKVLSLMALPSSCEHNHGLLLYPEWHLAFIACDGNARLLVLDLTSHRILDVLPTGEDPDVLAMDEKRGLLYVASESGVLSVYRLEGRRVTLLGQGDAGDNAHTVSVDPETGLIYLPIRNLDGHPALKIMAPPG